MKLILASNAKEQYYTQRLRYNFLLTKANIFIKSTLKSYYRLEKNRIFARKPGGFLTLPATKTKSSQEGLVQSEKIGRCTADCKGIQAFKFAQLSHRLCHFGLGKFYFEL